MPGALESSSKPMATFLVQPVRIVDEKTIKEYFPDGTKFAKVLEQKPELDLYHLCSVGKSVARLERCLKNGPDVNKPNEMGSTALMFACTAWSPAFVSRLLEVKADVNIEDRNGATALDVVNDEIKLWEEREKQEREDCRRRRLEMEVTGTLMWDRPNVEDLEPFNEMHKLYQVQKVLQAAGARPGENRRKPGYD
ncbi:unnamed protein product [Polarella glacialis]|uniref:Uncharacterized protein n=1 Tax=Polarella glacialis TaxID=89957 RepID=A0A813GDW0_POLGL|nr:unnamed protein product [Polarella glacialis]CAE8647019.1 unnamed protein product [Polarella glacialis]